MPSFGVLIKYRSRSKELVALLMVVISILLVLFIVFSLSSSNNGEESRVVEEQQKFSDDINQLVLNGEAYKAVEAIEAKGEEADSMENLLLLASVYMNDEKPGKAIDVYQKIIETTDAPSGVYGSAASAAEQAGRPDQAIEFYTEAIAKAKDERNNPVASSDIEFYQTRIRNLQGE